MLRRDLCDFAVEDLPQRHRGRNRFNFRFVLMNLFLPQHF